MPLINRWAARWRGALALLAVAAALLALPPRPASAQSCYVNDVLLMDFGSVTSAGRSATTALNYTCAPDYSGAKRTFYYQLCVTIDQGSMSLGQSTRRMGNYNGAYLRYDLFADPAHTQLIVPPGGSPVYQLSLAVPPGAALSSTIPIYGRVYPGQSVPAAYAFEEQGHRGDLRWLHSTTGYPSTTDCSGGDGGSGGRSDIRSSGVYARFENSCLVSATDLDFGAVPSPERPVRGASSISVQCPPGTSWKLGLDNGQNYDGSMRRMAGAEGFLQYQLYRDESHTMVWGNAEGSMASGMADASGSTQTLRVHGLLPPQPNALSGGYSDTVVVTLYY